MFKIFTPKKESDIQVKPPWQIEEEEKKIKYEARKKLNSELRSEVINPLKEFNKVYKKEGNKNVVNFRFDQDYYKEKFDEIDFEKMGSALKNKDAVWVLKDIGEFLNTKWIENTSVKHLPYREEVRNKIIDIFNSNLDLLKLEGVDSKWKYENGIKNILEALSEKRLGDEIDENWDDNGKFSTLLADNFKLDDLHLYANDRNNIKEFIMSQPDHVLKSEIFKEIDGDFKKKNTNEIGWLLKLNQSESIRNVAVNKFSDLLKDDFGLEYDKFFPDKGSKLVNEMYVSEFNIKYELDSMYEIERKREGGVKELFENYGIKEFNRYPVDLLLAQLEEEDVDQPYGVIAFPRGDWNSAFDRHKEVLSSLYDQTRGHYGLKVFEAEKTAEIARHLIKLDNKYGDKHKISFAILAGHGSKNSIELSPYDVRSLIVSNNFVGEGFKKVKKFFIDNPSIVLFSCSTGKEGGIAEKMSKTYGATVIAPDRDAGVDSLDVNYNSDDKPSFEVKYTRDAKTMLYKDMEK